MKTFFYRIFCGFFLGLSIFAPGFSGSVVAIAMGIYQDLIRIVSNPFKQLKENIIFCIPLVIGAVLSGILFIIGFKILFETYEKATYILFIGLIAGNIPVIYSEVKKFKFKKLYLVGVTSAFAIALTLGILATSLGHPAEDGGFTASLPLLAVSGFSGGAAAFVPGMSISMILIIFGVYSQLIIVAEALIRMDFAHLFPFVLFGFSALIGLVSTARGIKYVFDKFPAFANYTVLGFMIGSLLGISAQSIMLVDEHFNWILGVGMLALGLGISMLFVIVGKTMNKDKEEIKQVEE